MEWKKISEEQPPTKEWLEFYDGEKAMGHHPPFNHIDILNHRMEARVSYLHNYTHWRHLTEPSMGCGACGNGCSEYEMCRLIKDSPCMVPT